ncbi:dTDP-D-glucose 4,6-dehydratase [Hokovirus HKV1]|uniref:dTDP-D-glucose 4,6-dehydratase n=1 Tax=Hokovirus HKV1 TaxID=1977638 RepID=A0A1V0SG27_9VIRU|nr:dTDP-D-glucose 4,6-dehydratase [Hokovirus HKV1]
MNVLIYGNGWIGNQYIQYFINNNINYSIGKSRVDNISDTKKEIEDINPTHILSTLGRTHGKINNKEYNTIDYLEQEGKLQENIRDNLFSPMILALICKEKNIHFTYLGTGCIFEYNDDNKQFTEESLPNFFGSSYSIVKGFSDRLMHMFDNDVLNLRIRMPITNEPNPRNFITKITSYKKILSIPNSMTVLTELIPISIDMMIKKTTGTFNMVNPGVISHNEILNMYKEIVDFDFKWENFNKEEHDKILCAKRSNNHLDTQKLLSLYPNILNIHDSVRKCLYDYKNYLMNNSVWVSSEASDSIARVVVSGNTVSEESSSVAKVINNDNDNLNNLIIDNECIILVTGGCGFIGSNFINYIGNMNKNIKIINIDSLHYCAKIENVNKNILESENYIFYNNDLNDLDFLKSVFNNHKINYVIHFAARTHVEYSFNETLKYVNDNVNATCVLLECCKNYEPLKKFIYFSTDEVYGETDLINNNDIRNENDKLNPTNPYSATKAGAELLSKSYYYSFKLPLIITRCNNVYGDNQYPDKIVSKFINLLENYEQVPIQGSGKNTRSYIHALDVAKAVLCVLAKGKIGEIYNIVGNDEYTNMELTELLIENILYTRDYNKWIKYVPDRIYNDTRYLICGNNLKNLGFKAEIKLIDYVKQVSTKKNIILCRADIFHFFKDYHKSLFENKKVLLELYNDMKTIINDKNNYIFYQSIPDKIFLDWYNKNKNFYVINTEQLTLTQWHNKMSHYCNDNIKVIDYSICNYNLLQHEQHIHVPYQYIQSEDIKLTNWIKNTAKTYDVAICTNNCERRNCIVQELIKNNISVINCCGWEDQRDQLIATAKILINIHYSDDYLIFEHLRCDRIVLAGQLLVSENSNDINDLDIKDLIIFTSYDKLVSTIIDILQNYDSYQESLNNTIINTKQHLIDNRIQKLELLNNMLNL